MCNGGDDIPHDSVSWIGSAFRTLGSIVTVLDFVRCHLRWFWRFRFVASLSLRSFGRFDFRFCSMSSFLFLDVLGVFRLILAATGYAVGSPDAVLLVHEPELLHRLHEVALGARLAIRIDELWWLLDMAHLGALFASLGFATVGATRLTFRASDILGLAPKLELLHVLVYPTL